MRLTQEAKVGLITIISIVLFALAVSYTGRYREGEVRSYNLVFDGVDGLQIHSKVNLAGVMVGYVRSLDFIEGQKVKVNIVVTRPDAPLYRAYREGTDTPGTFYTYTVNGDAVGDRWVEILPGQVPPDATPLEPGATVAGERPMTLNEIARKGHKILGKLDNSVDSISLLASDPEQGGLRGVVEDFQKTSENLRKASDDTSLMVAGLTEQSERLSDSLDTVVTKVDQNLLGLQTGEISAEKVLEKLATNSAYRSSNELNAMVVNLNDTSHSIKKAIRAVELLSETQPLDRTSVAAVKDLRNAAEDIQGIAMELRNSKLPVDVERELREASANSKLAIASAARIMGRVDAYAREKFSDTIAPAQDSEESNSEKEALILKVNQDWKKEDLLEKYLFKEKKEF